MLAECLEYLAIKPDGTYLECTAGLGGHTRAIAERLTTGLLISCDRDAESLDLARANTAAVADRIHFYQASFTELERTLETEEVSQLDKTRSGPLQVDGLLADLGVSRYQLTRGGEGVLAHVGRPVGYAHGSQPATDRRRHRQFRIGKGARRLDLQVGRGKEEPEDSQSNRAGAADTNAPVSWPS